MDAFAAKIHDHIGIGGINCSCCNPYINGDKAQSRRRARHQLKHDLVSEVNEAVAYLDEVKFVQSITITAS